MAFRELEATSLGRGRKPEVGTVNALVMANGTIRFAIASDILAAIGSPPAVRVMVGDGEHAGHIAMVPASSGKSGSFKVRTPKNGHQGVVLVAATRLGLSRSRRPTVSLPVKTNGMGVVLDVSPISAPYLAAVA